MANLNALSNSTTAATSLSNLILVSPQTNLGYQPQNKESTNGLLSNLLNLNPNSLLFHYEGEQTISLESDITDHFVEDNTALQDQIALRPEIVTTHGFIGELNDVAPPGLNLLKTAANKLTAINAYSPGLSVTAQIAYNRAFQAYQVGTNLVNAATSVWSSLTGSGNQNKQQTMFNQLYGYWRQRILFTVQTPWAVLNDMAIYKLRAIQDAETNVITDFELTFKKIRKASTIITKSVQSAILAAQAASPTNLGTQTPASDQSVGSATSSSFPGK